MKQNRRFAFVSRVLLAAAIAGCSQISERQEPQSALAPPPVPQTTTVAQAATEPAASTGMTAHKDPVTGRFVPAPAGGAETALSQELRDATSMSHEGLVEVPAPGGGFMVDLRGRFQQATTATVSEAGAVTVRCGQRERREKE